jgi:hypothetical protein
MSLLPEQDHLLPSGFTLLPEIKPDPKGVENFSILLENYLPPKLAKKVREVREKYLVKSPPHP